MNVTDYIKGYEDGYEDAIRTLEAVRNERDALEDKIRRVYEEDEIKEES